MSGMWGGWGGMWGGWGGMWGGWGGAGAAGYMPIGCQIVFVSR
jgi:hypothetical protein